MRLSVQVALTPPDASLVQLAEHRTFNADVRSSSLRRRTTSAFLAQLAERRAVNPRVAGSSPAERAICVFSSVGRAADSYSEGRGFDPLKAHQMHEWRNWNTRQTKDLVPAKSL